MHSQYFIVRKISNYVRESYYAKCKTISCVTGDHYDDELSTQRQVNDSKVPELRKLMIGLHWY